MPDHKVTINVTELKKMIVTIVTVLSLGVPALIYVAKTYHKINFMFKAFYEAAAPEQKAEFNKGFFE